MRLEAIAELIDDPKAIEALKRSGIYAYGWLRKPHKLDDLVETVRDDAGVVIDIKV